MILTKHPKLTMHYNYGGILAVLERYHPAMSGPRVDNSHVVMESMRPTEWMVKGIYLLRDGEEVWAGRLSWLSSKPEVGGLLV